MIHINEIITFYFKLNFVHCCLWGSAQYPKGYILFGISGAICKIRACLY